MAISKFLLPDRRESVPTCCNDRFTCTTWSFATIQFSKPSSSWPLGGARLELDFPRAPKSPLNEWASGDFPVCRKATFGASPQLSIRVQSLAKGVYHFAPRCQPYGRKTSRFSKFCGAPPLCRLKPLASQQGATSWRKSSASRIVARVRAVSSSARKKGQRGATSLA